MKAAQSTVRQIEFELKKGEHRVALPYDAERAQWRNMRREARKQKVSAGLRARRGKAHR
jgi:hypothetical protein